MAVIINNTSTKKWSIFFWKMQHLTSK